MVGLNGLDRIVAVLDALQRAPGATLAEVARATDLSEATTHRYLAALREHRLIMRDAKAGNYRLGTKLFELGHSALRGQDPPSVAQPHLRALRDEFGETAVLAANYDGRLVIIAVEEALHEVAKGAKIGEPDPWHSTSLGKAILAEMPAAQARTILEGNECTPLTPRTLTDPKAVLASLHQVHSDGVAMDDEESEIGLRCIGAAVRDARGLPSFAISVSGPTYRITLDTVSSVARAVKAAAAAISRDLGWPGPEPSAQD